MVTDACVNCGTCETVCPERSADGTSTAIYSEFYDGRVVRTVDLETCSFCGACAEKCPVGAIDFTQSPERVNVKAGAILTAVGCEPAPARFIEHLGYGHERRGHADRARRAARRLGGAGVAGPRAGATRSS